MHGLQSTRTRLALTYLAIIMVLSISFSAVFYNISTNEAGGGLRRQTVYFQNENVPFGASPFDNRLEQVRTRELDTFRSRLLVRLFELNLGMLILGGLFSFWLAKRSLDPLEEAMEAQDRFTSDAAHELRTPLTAMKTEIEVAMRGSKMSAAEAKEVLSSTLEEIAKLETLTNALLRLAKSSGQSDTESWRTIKLKKLVKEAAERVKLAAEQQHITINSSGVGSDSVRGDHDQLLELVVTLLDNAIKYGQEGMEITLSSETTNGQVVLNVADKGLGIKASELPHIFERFYRADQSRTKNNVPGYGLGLSLAEQIAKQHNGSITAVSQVGEGSTFTVTLPANTPSASVNSQAEPVQT